MHPVPAIDLIDGRCVRLTEGDFAQQTTYADDPLEMAKRFEAAGLGRLHLVDLDGARRREPVNLAVLERIARHTSLQIDYGGGLQSDEAVERAFSAGARQITAGSIAVREPARVEGWLQRFGAERIVVGADFRDGTISIDAWATQSTLSVDEFVAAYLRRGARTFVCTDVSRDGKLQGPSTASYAALCARFPEAELVASGGVTRIEDLHALRALGMHSAIVGKAIYEGSITLRELGDFAKGAAC